MNELTRLASLRTDRNFVFRDEIRTSFLTGEVICDQQNHTNTTHTHLRIPMTAASQSIKNILAY